ncbi:SH3 domain-containing protein [Clostridium thermobutyricum]|uniref:SH3 domain-containing protein n=1 Tax=Clostridium thermobutyricum TaxID=29372 RepID=UPI0018ABC871|nr:SH3 domain-containing protein [Clostridium thermobutyricum]
MVKKKITAILISVGMIFTAGAPTIMAHAEQVNKAPITHMATKQATSQMAVVNERVAVMQGAKTTGYANKYDMATIISTNGNVCNVVTEFGLQGQINKSALNMVQSGVNQPLQTVKKEGHVSNVTTVLNVRTEPTTASSIKAQLTNNTNFEIVGQQGDWLKINVGNETGFVFNEFTSEGHSNVGGRVITGSEMQSASSSSVVSSTVSATGSSYANVQHNNATSSVARTSSSVSSTRTSSTTGTSTSKTTVKANTANKVTQSGSESAKTTVKETSTSSKSNSSSKVEHKTVEKNTPVSNKSEHYNTNKDSNSEHHSTVNSNTQHHATADQTHGQSNNSPESNDPNIHNTKNNNENQSGAKQRTWAYNSNLSSQVQNLINQFRKENGLNTLSSTATTNKEAIALGNKLAQNETSEHGEMEMGNMITSGAVQGNVAEQIFNCFKNSPAHRKEMLSQAQHMSVAVFKDSNGNYYTAVQFDDGLSGMNWN